MATFTCALPVHITFVAQGPLGRDVWKQEWNKFSNEKHFQLNYGNTRDANGLKALLAAANIFFVAQRTVEPSVNPSKITKV